MPIPVEQLIIQILGDAKEFKKSIEDVKKQNRKAGDTFKKFEKVAVASFLAVGASATLLAKKAVSSFATFETGLTNVAKTTNLAGKDLNKFRGNIIKMSEKIPVGTDRLLEIGTAAGQLGIKGVTNLTDFTEVIAKLGATTDVEGGDAALAIARIMNLTNEAIDGSDGKGGVKGLGAALVELGNNFAASESEILEVAKDVAKATVNFELTSDRVLGISAAMASLGIQAEAGGTVIGKAFQAIDSAVREQGGPAFDKLVELTKLTGDQLTKTFQEDSSRVFQLFIEGLGNAKDEGGDLTKELEAMGLSGIRVNKILPTLASRSDILAEAMTKSGEAAKKASALNEEAAKAFATTASQLEIATTKINNSLIVMGEEIAPNAIDSINELSNAVKTASPLWKQLGKVLGGVAKGVSNIITFFSKVAETGTKTVLQATKDIRDETAAAAKKDEAFFKDQLKKRGVKASGWRKHQRKLRREAAKQRIEDLKEDNKKLEDETKKANQNSADKQKEAAAIRLQRIKDDKQKEADAQIKADEELTDQLLFEVVERYEKQKKAQEKAIADQIKADDEMMDQLLFNVVDRHEKEQKASKKHFGELDDLYAKHHGGVLLSETLFGQQMVKLKEFQGSAEFGAVQTAAGSVAELVNSENNELKEIGKAGALVQMGISTVQSAMQAFASVAWIPYVGPGLGVILAAAVSGYGLEKMNEIRGMKEGGVVPGVGRGDKVPTLLEPGELVVPRGITADILKASGARQMQDGGLASKEDASGQKQGSALLENFNDIFGVPGIFLSILGFDGGDDDTSASGFGAESFVGMADAMIGDLVNAADELLRVFLSAIPGGEFIYEAMEALGLTPTQLKKMMDDTKVGELLKQIGLDDEVMAAVNLVWGTGMGALGGLIGAAENIGNDIADFFGFQNGGMVGMTEPGEMRISQEALSAIANGVGMGNNNTMPTRHISQKPSNKTGSQTARFEFFMNDNLAEFITIKQREGQNLGTMILP